MKEDGKKSTPVHAGSGSIANVHVVVMHIAPAACFWHELRDDNHVWHTSLLTELCP